MDIATVVGLVLGHVLIFGSIMMGAGIGAFVDIPSVIIVVGGTIAAVMVSFPMNKFTTTGKVIKKSLMFALPDPTEKIEEMAQFAALARKEGLLALEEKLGALDDAFLVKGLRLVVDGFPPEVVRDILESDLAATQERHGVGKAIMDKMGEVAPAFGMIGTLIGLVAMLGNMEDPSGIGAGMAVALLTTLYGAIMSNAIFLPMADKLALRSAEEALAKTIIIKGVMSIQAGDNPRVVDSKLRTFLPPNLRKVDADDAEMKQAA